MKRDSQNKQLSVGNMNKRTSIIAAIFALNAVFSIAADANSNFYRSSSDASYPAQSYQFYSNAQQQPAGKHASGREDIAYEDPRDADIKSRALRKGDWDYRQNWRYNREAFYKGETQGDAYLESHQEGQASPGIYSDEESIQMRREYEQSNTHRQNPQQR